MDRIVGILLAAGASKRFGGDKLMQYLPDGELVAVRACRNLLAGTDEVLAVVRPGNEQLTTLLQTAGAKVLTCAEAEQGMGASLAFGVRFQPHAFGWLIALADMPWIAPSSIRQVADALRSGATIAAPSWQGQRGHPVGFAQVLGSELAALTGDVGAKALIQAHLGQMHIIDCDDSGIVRDIDTPRDLAS
jgi:molybdenum cofactor cytidylyltransferase